jgi:hypothetical protein
MAGRGSVVVDIDSNANKAIKRLNIEELKRLKLTGEQNTDKRVERLTGRSVLAEWCIKIGLLAMVLPTLAKGVWEPAVEPLHVDIDTAKTCGVGPGTRISDV